MNNYVKIVYQSEPIGKERIILYLTTFDKEAFDRDNIITTKQEKKVIEFSTEEFNRPDFVEMMEKNINSMVKNIYEDKINELEEIINRQKMFGAESKPKVIKNISNVDDVHCGIVFGNIVNCDNIYCTEIKGNVVNCDKIIYK